MAKVTDLLSSLGVAEDGISTVYPETFVGDIQTAYDEDFAPVNAKVQVLETELAQAKQEILLLQAHNYELMVSAPVEEQAETEEEAPEEAPDNDDNSGVDSLFKEKKEAE